MGVGVGQGGAPRSAGHAEVLGLALAATESGVDLAQALGLGKSWQKSMTTKWSQLAKPLDRRSQPVSRTSLAKRFLSMRERSWLKRLEVATFMAALPVRNLIGFSFTPIPSVQGGFFNPLFWTVVVSSSGRYLAFLGLFASRAD